MDEHIDDTRYVQWEDGMYVMIDDLECEYEWALVEDSLRCSIYFEDKFFFNYFEGREDCLGVCSCIGGFWVEEGYARIKLTRAQALYIAIGETTCTTY